MSIRWAVLAVVVCVPALPGSFAYGHVIDNDSDVQTTVHRASLPAGFSFAIPFVEPNVITLKNVFPEWPADETLAGQTDLQTVLAVQAVRTLSDIAAARRDATLGPVEWAAELFGEKFNAARLPVTAALLARIRDDFEPYAHKSPYEIRGRPRVRDGRIEAVLASTLFSYPSARAASAYIAAEVLAQVMLSHHQKLSQHAARSGWLQVVAGVHYPTDLAAGRLLGAAFVAELRRASAYRDAVKQAREEIFVVKF